MFALTEYNDSQGMKLMLIKDWKDIVTEVRADLGKAYLRFYPKNSSLECSASMVPCVTLWVSAVLDS